MDSGSSEKNLVRVTIFQYPYTLRSSGEPGETEALARTVDELMNQIASRGAVNDPARVAVLTSLHLADRVRALERQITQLLDRAEKLEEHASRILDESR